MTAARKKPPVIPASPISREEAEWMGRVDEITVRNMVEWLKAGVDLRRPIDTLNKAALSALAEIARATYGRELSKRREEIAARPPAEREQMELWLL
jgi:hypothetical protein